MKILSHSLFSFPYAFAVTLCNTTIHYSNPTNNFSEENQLQSEKLTLPLPER